MADYVLSITSKDDLTNRINGAKELVSRDQNHVCYVYGNDGTFNIIRNGEDVIASIGYTSHIDRDSAQDTLVNILNSFDESHIGEYKTKLIGQYVLFIKKNEHIYIFTDFMGGRNVFYSDNGLAFSSSFSMIENLLGTSKSDLDQYKVFEYLAMRHVLYPSWLGSGTQHKGIKWLLPNEYIVFKLEDYSYKIGRNYYAINNTKISDRLALAQELITNLNKIVYQKEFQDSFIGASLTGGRDSRLVAAVAQKQYKNIHYRTAVSTDKYNSLKDLEVAKKISGIHKIPMDIYTFNSQRDWNKFYEVTEGFAPTYNHSITPLIENAGKYSLGFGGVFGTELFMPIPWPSIDSFINDKITNIKRYFHVGNDYLKRFLGSLQDEFRRLKNHFKLNNALDQDYIRLFLMLDTARYSSFILSAFNLYGYQLEPYGHYDILSLALRVDPSLWGNHRRFGGNALVQNQAMSMLDVSMGRILTYSTFRPMLPLSAATFPFYLVGYTIQILNWLRQKYKEKKQVPIRTNLPGGYYLSDGWEQQFVDRTEEKYGFSPN